MWRSRFFIVFDDYGTFDVSLASSRQYYRRYS